MIIFVFGDSIALGRWDSKGGWVDRIKAYVNAEAIATELKECHQVYNLAVDGDTTKQLLDRFDAETSLRLWPDEECGFIFAIGINDTRLIENQMFLSTPDDYRSHLEALISRVNEYSRQIAFINLTPVDKLYVSYRNEQIDQFNEVLCEFCRLRGSSYIDVNQSFKTRNELLADGLHPNDEGHEIIYDQVLPIVLGWLSNTSIG